MANSDELTIHNIPQNSEEWSLIRGGKVTGSGWHALDVNGKQENGFGVGAITIMKQIAEERITGTPQENFSNKATDWGHTYEDEARSYYELTTFQKVEQVGFVQKNEWVGCSPDGLINKDGVWEAKCLPKEHMSILIDNKPDKNHVKQVQFELWVTGRSYAHLVYFHPNHPPKTKMVIFTIKADKEYHQHIQDRVNTFVRMTEKLIRRLK